LSQILKGRDHFGDLHTDNNVKIDLKGMGREFVDYIKINQNSVQ
jgi:hypothetical protein